jgi:hypothetical protein
MMDHFFRVSKTIQTHQFDLLIAVLNETTDGYIECQTEISKGKWLVLIASRDRRDAERVWAFCP